MIAQPLLRFVHQASHARRPTRDLYRTVSSKGVAPAVDSEDSVCSSHQKPGSVTVHSALAGGCIDYCKSWAWQHVLMSRRLARRRQRQQQSCETKEESSAVDGDCVLLLEHAPVYTLGRGADENHLTFLSGHEDDAVSQEARRKLSRKSRGLGTARLAVDRSSEDPHPRLSLEDAVDQLVHLASPVIAPNGVPVYRVERGGEVTFHGPSQLVVYPLLDLKGLAFQADLHWYLRMVEEVVIQTLQHYNIEGIRDEDNTGVWVQDAKVAAVGISSSRWITSHGLALNVDPDLEYFDTSVILPCGIEGKGVTSMARLLLDRGEPVPTIQEVADVVVQTMASVFGVDMKQNGLTIR